MSQPIVRENDEHIGHGTPVANFHKTQYVSTVNGSVFANSRKVIVVGDNTTCGDPAVVGSSSVFIDGHPIHRVADGTGGHGPWIPNQADVNDCNVYVG